MCSPNNRFYHLFFSCSEPVVERVPRAEPHHLVPPRNDVASAHNEESFLRSTIKPINTYIKKQRRIAIANLLSQHKRLLLEIVTGDGDLAVGIVRQMRKDRAKWLEAVKELEDFTDFADV